MNQTIQNRLEALDAAIDAFERQIRARYPRARRDAFGMLPRHHEEIIAELRAHERGQRRAALAALWGRPILDYVRRDGVRIYTRNREEEWTVWRAVQATVGLILGRYWGDADEARWRRRAALWRALVTAGARHRVGLYGLTLAYWDSREVYGGYSVEVLNLYPGCRIDHFNDGETFL